MNMYFHDPNSFCFFFGTMLSCFVLFVWVGIFFVFLFQVFQSLTKIHKQQLQQNMITNNNKQTTNKTSCNIAITILSDKKGNRIIWSIITPKYESTKQWTEKTENKCFFCHGMFVFPCVYWCYTCCTCIRSIAQCVVSIRILCSSLFGWSSILINDDVTCHSPAIHIDTDYIDITPYT